jgi:hypothetical protein
MRRHDTYRITLLATCLAVFTALALVAIWSAPPAFAEEGKSNYERAMDYYYAGDYENAAALLKEYVKEHPDPKAYFRIGYSLYKLGRHDEANEYFEQSYLVSPGYSPTPELENKHDRLKDVRPEGFYEGRVKKQPLKQEQAPAVPEGYMADEQPSTLAVPTQEQPGEEAVPMTEEAAPIEEAAFPAEEPAPAEEAAFPAEEPAPAEEALAPEPAPAPPAAKPTPPPPTPAAPPFELTEKQAAFAVIAMLSAFLIPIAVIFAVLYFIFSFSLFKISGKLNLGRKASIFSWIPVLQALTMTWAAGKSTLWGIIFILTSLLLGPVGMIIGIYFWMCIAENLGKSKWVGLLILVPVINILLPLFLAFTGVAQTGMAATAGAEGFGDISGEPSLDLPDVPEDFDDMDFAEPDFSQEEAMPQGDDQGQDDVFDQGDDFDNVGDFEDDSDMNETDF